MAWNQKPPPISIRKDGYVNMLNKYGTAQDNSMAYEYGFENIIPDITLTTQYETNGLFSKIIDAPAEEAVKHGFSLGLKGSDVEKQIFDKLELLEWEDNAATAIKWSRLYGGAIGVMLIDDGGDIDEPLSWSRIKDIEEIRIYERAVVWPDYASIYNFGNREPLARTATKFGMPEFYYVQSMFGQFWVHESRCLVFRNGILPERTLNPYYRFWGMPEYARIRKELRETVTTHGNGVRLLERSVQAIYGMKGLAMLLATEEGENEVVKRLRTVDMSRGILNSVAIDSEGETYDFKSAPMSGVKEIVDSTCNMLSAVSKIPQAILFGRSPAGMNATGESDLENWYNYVQHHQKLMLKNNLNTVISAVIRAAINNGEMEEVPNVRVEFNPLWSMSESDKTRNESERARTQLTKAQAAKIYVDLQALDPSEIRRSLAKEDEYHVEEVITEEDLANEGIWGGDYEADILSGETLEKVFEDVMADE